MASKTDVLTDTDRQVMGTPSLPGHVEQLMSQHQSLMVLLPDMERWDLVYNLKLSPQVRARIDELAARLRLLRGEQHA
jgi:hypothetical protein